MLYSGGDGRIIVTDSTSYLDKRVNEHDVIVASSFAGNTIIGGALAKGIKALIAQDAGVGKDNAAISGLPYGDRYGVPVAAVDCKTATLSNGNSALAGIISHANEAAGKLGVRAGQGAREAAQLLLKAPPGKPVPLALDLDNKLYEMEVTPKGRILAIWALFYLPKDKTYPDDVFCGRHTFGAASPQSMRSAGTSKAGSPMTPVPARTILASRGSRCAARRACRRLRSPQCRRGIGDGLSTYREGVISFVNEPARAKGIAMGMTAKDALRLMMA